MIVEGPLASGAPLAGNSESRTLIAELEMRLLLDGVVRLSGFDFHEYSPTLLKRRVSERMRAEDVGSITGLLERIIHQPAVLERFLYAMTTTASPPFRDVPFFCALASEVVPRLRTYPFFRLWVVGNGAEAHLVSILLLEAGLLERARIYATEATETGLADARLGLIPPDNLPGAQERYLACGGKRQFADYVETTALGLGYKRELAQNILFARHHVAAEGSFNEFQGVIVRTPLTSFGRALAYRVHETLYESIGRLGFLCLTTREDMNGSPHRGAYEPLTGTEAVFRRLR